MIRYLLDFKGFCTSVCNTIPGKPNLNMDSVDCLNFFVPTLAVGLPGVLTMRNRDFITSRTGRENNTVRKRRILRCYVYLIPRGSVSSSKDIFGLLDIGFQDGLVGGWMGGAEPQAS